MIVAVTGGRNYDDFNTVYHVLDYFNQYFKIRKLISGGATGADSLAEKVAKDLDIPVEVFPADWDRYGNYAGPKRNQQMIDAKPDMVIAFPGGKGTENMVSKAKLAGILVLMVPWGYYDSCKGEKND